MNKKPILLIVSLLGGLSLSSCESINPVETVKIDVWAPKEEQKVIETVVNNWNSTHKEEYQFKLSFDVEDIEKSTLIYSNSYNLRELISNKQISSIEEKFIKDKFIDISIDSVNYNELYYGYPISFDSSYYLYYNNQYLDNKEVESLEKILRIAKDNNKQVLFDISNAYYAASFLLSPQACGLDSIRYEINSEGKAKYDINWDNETAVKVSTYISSLLTPYYIDGTLMMMPSFNIDSNIRYEKIIALVSSSTYDDKYMELLGDNLSADKLPTYNIDKKEYQLGSFSSTSVYCINSNASNEEIKTANALAQLLTNKESQLIRYQENKELPTNKKIHNDKGFLKELTAGERANILQSEYSCVQAKSIEDKFWEVVNPIGKAYINSDLNGLTWSDFLKNQIELLR